MILIYKNPTPNLKTLHNLQLQIFPSHDVKRILILHRISKFCLPVLSLLMFSKMIGSKFFANIVSESTWLSATSPNTLDEMTCSSPLPFCRASLIHGTNLVIVSFLHSNNSTLRFSTAFTFCTSWPCLWWIIIQIKQNKS